jgi:cytochrome c5
MKCFHPVKLRQRAWLCLAAVAAAFCAVSGLLVACAGPQSANPTASGVKTEATEKPAPKKLTGAELYSINCNRCHAERYPTEFTSAQWKTVMTHMRVRANLPAAQATEILKYLQEDSGN